MTRELEKKGWKTSGVFEGGAYVVRAMRSSKGVLYMRMMVQRLSEAGHGTHRPALRTLRTTHNFFFATRVSNRLVYSLNAVASKLHPDFLNLL